MGLRGVFLGVGLYFVDLDNDPTLTRQVTQEAARFKKIISANVTDLERNRKSAPEIGG
ncbi:MAG: hypothetical protein OSA84_05500 [Akkermansiaceae bacterium]|nr:hypothetical protein [Akkermansiaceae bacterium]